MTEEKPAAFKEKLRREIREFLLIFLYLALFFCTFATYRRLLLREMGMGYFHYGFALLKALIFAKVILLGQHISIARKFDDRPLIFPTIYKVIVFSVLLVLFEIAEHIVGSLLHDKGIAHAFAELLGPGRDELVARAMIVLFAFLPFFAFTETGRVLGEGRLRAMFFGSKAPKTL